MVNHRLGIPKVLIMVAAIALVTSSCLQGPNFFKQQAGSVDSSQGITTISAEILTDENGVLTAVVKSDSKSTQLVEASKASAVAGTSIQFPPGSLAVSSQITVEAGTSLATKDFATDLGLSEDVGLEPAGTTVVITADQNVDATAPFTLAIPVPADSSLWSLLTASSNYVVVYRVKVASLAKTFNGIIPSTELAIVNGVLQFKTTYFGAYQIAKVARPLTVRKEAETKEVIVTQRNAASVPFELTQIAPLAIPAGEKVVLGGKNFRPTLTLAINGRRVKNIEVESDVSASFVMPEDIPYGFADLAIEQDGVVESMKLFARVDKTELPLITMDPAGVCKGVRYYDAQGQEQVGTRDCETAAAIDKDNDGIADTARHAESATNAAYSQNAGFANSAGDAETVGGKGLSTTPTPNTIVLRDNKGAIVGDLVGSISGNAGGSAEWSKGKAGTPISNFSGGTLNLDGSGNFYEISGSTSNVVLMAIETLPSGQRMILSFQDDHIIVQHSASLVLLGARDFYPQAGDMMEFISDGHGRWKETRRVAPTHFRGAINSSFIVNGNMSGSGESGVQLAFDTVQDPRGEFKSGTFTAAEDGLYGIFVDMKGTPVTTGTSGGCYFNASKWIDFSGNGYYSSLIGLSDYAYSGEICHLKSNSSNFLIYLNAGDKIHLTTSTDNAIDFSKSLVTIKKMN